MGSIASFYAPTRWGSRWGVVDANHPTPHKGLDIRASAGTPVPSLEGGTIVADLPSASVGRYIIVHASSGYLVYAHIVSAGHKGTVDAGDILGRVAGARDPHGSAWTGPHIHLVRSLTRSGWTTFGPSNINPEPLVLVLVARDGDGSNPAGGGGVPITIPPEALESDMRMQILYDVTPTVPDAQKRVLFIPGALWLPITAAESIEYEKLIVALDKKQGVTGVTVATLNCSAGSMARYKATVPVNGMPVDVDEAAVGAAVIAGLTPLLSGLSLSQVDKAAIIAGAGDAARTAIAAALANG